MDIHEPSEVEHGHSGQILFSSAGRHLPKAGRSHDRAAAVGLQARRCDLLGHNTHRDGGLAKRRLRSRGRLCQAPVCATSSTPRGSNTSAIAKTFSFISAIV